MAKAHAEAIIDQAPDVVWGRIHDFGDVSWIPNTGASRQEGDLRIVTMQGSNFEVAQQLLNHDEANRTYSYCMATELDLSALFGPGRVVRKLEATIAVMPKGESSSWVIYDVDTEDFLVEGTNAEYQGALDNLKALVEG